MNTDIVREWQKIDWREIIIECAIEVEMILTISHWLEQGVDSHWNPISQSTHKKILNIDPHLTRIVTSFHYHFLSAASLRGWFHDRMKGGKRLWMTTDRDNDALLALRTVEIKTLER